ncbi:hypothetical protein PAXRUDRAFT_40826, partial [Paxillus rubicundulus Ve08.2h10]
NKPRPVHTSILTGQGWLNELLTGHPVRFYNMMGMDQYVFRKLSCELQLYAGLSNSKHVSADEKLAIFLH